MFVGLGRRSIHEGDDDDTLRTTTRMASEHHLQTEMEKNARLGKEEKEEKVEREKR